MLPNDGRVVSNFICQALQGEDITIYGDGSQTRSFCFINDMVNGLTKLMESPESGPINLGNPHEVTIKELAETILRLIKGSNSEIVYRTLPKDDPTRRKPDISLAKKTLKWQPKTPLKEGLKATITYFEEELEITNG
jgi:UDP-glucuronate decarboxylase